MSATKINSGSETSLNSNSSWSVIEDSLISPHNLDLQKRSHENDTDIDVSENCKNEVEDADNLSVYLNENVENPLSASDEEKTNEGFLNFDEYYQVKMNESSNEVSDDTSKTSKEKNHKIEMISILSLIASLLTITGLTLLMMMFPSNLSKTDYEAVQNNYLQTIKTTNFTPEEILTNLSRASESLNILQESDVMNNAIDNLQNMTLPDNNLIDDEFIFNFTNEEATCPAKTKSKKSYSWLDGLPITKNIKTLSDLLTNGNFHRIICTLLQDICLIKLIYQLNKKFAPNGKIPPAKEEPSNEKQTEPKKHSTAKIVLPISMDKAEFEKEIQDNINKIIKKYPKLKSYTSKITLLPKLKKEKASSKIRSSSPNLKVKENGKSECERRFEDLEKQLDFIGMTHRQSIQEIKKKFKEEMSNIDNENGLKSRTERIQETHGKYVERLKRDRERYLEQLQKFREERQKVMTELCKKKNSEVNFKKDVSVGYNTVLLPGCYDFQEKLRIMRIKERCCDPTENHDENNNPELNPKPKVKNSKRKSKNTTASATSINIPKRKYSTVVLNGVESTPIVPIHKQSILECNTEDEAEITNEDPETEFKLTIKNKGKIHQADFYSSLFDRKGLEIHKKDLQKWSNSLPANLPIKIVSKQDPKKGYQEKIIIKGKF